MASLILIYIHREVQVSQVDIVRRHCHRESGGQARVREREKESESELTVMCNPRSSPGICTKGEMHSAG